MLAEAEPPTSSNWPWLKECGLIIADPIPPVNKYDERPSVKVLLTEHQKLIEQVRMELVLDPLYDRNKHDDLWIMRFIMSHKKKLKDSIKAAKRTLLFRKEYGLDDNDIRYNTSLDGFASQSFERYLKYCKDDVFSFVIPDQQRGVVGFINLGSMDQHELVKNVDNSDWLPCFMFFSEWAYQWIDYVSRTTGRFTKSIRFADASELKMSGLNKELTRRDGEAMGTMEDYYPQLLQTLYVCHAPVWIQVPWRIVRPLFPKRVTSKFDFITPESNEHERERLMKYISIEHLPKRYGGLNEQWPVNFPLQKK
jgi:CRAL/TRIO domain